MTSDCSTPIFSAPEQLARRPYTSSVDIWAFGCCLVALCHDVQSPYDGMTSGREAGRDNLLMRVERGELRPRLDPASEPADFVRIVDACCRLSMEERPSAKQMLLLYDPPDAKTKTE